MGDLFAQILCYINYALVSLVSYIIDAFMLILLAVVTLVNLTLSLLPSIAFDTPNIEESWIGTVNWAIPLGPAMTLLTFLVVMTIVYKLIHFIVKHAE